MQTKTPRFQLAHRGSARLVSISAMLGKKERRLRTLVPLAVGADLVVLELEKTLDGGGVLGCPLGSRVGRSSGHGGGHAGQSRGEDVRETLEVMETRMRIASNGDVLGAEECRQAAMLVMLTSKVGALVVGGEVLAQERDGSA